MRLISSGICVFIINIIGYLINDFSFNSIGTLGIFTFLNYSPKEGDRIMKRLIFVGPFLFISYCLGMISTLNIWLPPIFIGIIGFTSRLLFRSLDIDKPGDIFVILVTAVGATSSVTIAEMPLMSLYFACGVILSIIMGYVTLIIEDMPKQSFHFDFNIIEPIRQNPRIIVDIFFYAIALFFTSYVNLAMGLGGNGWMIISCSAILQGNTLSQIFSRNFQRIVGTILGLITASVLLTIIVNPIIKIGLIVVFYMVVEYFIPRNYSIGIFFVTNMVMMQITLSSSVVFQQLLRERFLGILIGSILGVLAALIQYQLYQFFSQSIINERMYEQDFNE